jgi:glycosyltransferase involved in cell wall biosynthesis
MRYVKERRVDRIVVVSRAVAEGNRLAESGIPFDVIPNFIPDALWERAGLPLGSDQVDDRIPEGPFILYVGDLSRDKGIHVLLEAYERLEGRPPLLLLGRLCFDTPTRMPAGALILESCPHALVMTAFRRCAVAVAPSIFPDPCPTVVIEAMAAGCALVATSAGGIADMVRHGESGLLVDSPDPGAIAHALGRLLDDQSLRERLGVRARQQATAFTARTAVDRIVTLYRSLVTPRAA